MPNNVHPDVALFDGEKSFPPIPSCEHFAGSEKLILKAFQLQHDYGPIFDITCDCEDGAAAGQERAHAEMVARLISSDANVARQAGVRIHDPSHAHCLADVDIILDGCAAEVAYITIPKTTSAAQLREVIDYIQAGCASRGITREIPIHVLVETHGALADVKAIAAMPWLQVLDFGLMDFVSAHNGAIPAAAMRSPGQFEHRLLARAKAEVVAAALANGVVPAHNVCLDLKDAERVHADASRARNEFGFLRMWSIYPAQIQPIVEAMRPDFSEVEDAAAILLLAQQADWGPIQYKGELHDRATYRYFWSALQRAAVTGVPIPPDARSAFLS
jgi:citrate lyase subunit beta/citryl-CoA lyase|eukprot:TRINITY_DN4876_c0_g1_i2.p3 TRINITY_DN4876_c0_g1~~TRINITY_DN4876_c0_g1_i2.p3  ORF type:complete len:331 (+),score=60.38 TRINITY_DN4876_c0_g1_i2:1265-2257(+)